jgi:SAM-dependent methyltransferase
MPQHQWIERLIHYQYVADLLRGHRVLEVGCGDGQGAAFVATEASHVVAVDTSPVELAESRRKFDLPNLEFVPGEPDRLQLESGSFDVVLVPELQRWIARGSFMPELRRVLAPGGVALLAVASADREGGRGMAYQDLLEYLHQSFANVRVLGEIPFHGTTVAEFEPEGEPEPEIDSSLVETDELPTHYLALCSDRPVPSLGYTILQVPADGTPAAELKELHGKFDELVEERAEAELKLEELRRQLADAERRLLEAGVEARHELTNVRRELREKQDRAESLSRELAEVRAALEECRSLQREGERAVDDVVFELRQQLEEQRERAQIELQQARQMLEESVASSQRRIRQLEEEVQRAHAGQPVPAGEELEQARARAHTHTQWQRRTLPLPP